MDSFEQCKISWEECNKEELKRLYNYQNKEIEHREPKHHQSSFYIEAIGDIFRELTKNCFFDKHYIKEKVRKLKDFTEQNGGDEREKCEVYMEHKQTDWDEYNKQINDWLKKLNEFKSIIEEADIDQCRKEILIQIPDIQKDLLLWTIYYKGTNRVEEKINNFITELKSRLD